MTGAGRKTRRFSGKGDEVDIVDRVDDVGGDGLNGWNLPLTPEERGRDVTLVFLVRFFAAESNIEDRRFCFEVVFWW